MTIWDAIFIYLLCGTISALTMYTLGSLKGAIAWVYEQQKNHEVLSDSEVRLVAEISIVLVYAIFWPVAVVVVVRNLVNKK